MAAVVVEPPRKTPSQMSLLGERLRKAQQELRERWRGKVRVRASALTLMQRVGQELWRFLQQPWSMGFFLISSCFFENTKDKYQTKMIFKYSAG